MNELARKYPGLSRCELLLLEIGSWGRREFVDPEEEKRLPLEAAMGQRLLKTLTVDEL